MKKILELIIVMSLVAGIFYLPVQAEDEPEPYVIYLPIISNEEYKNPQIGPDSGFVVRMVADPQNSQIIYAGTWGNGVFKSVDGGITWKRYSNGLGDLYINSIGIDPQNPRILYAGTYNDAIYKTTNSGETWVHSSAGIQENSVVYTIAIDPYNPDIIYIGTRGKNVTNPPPWKGVVYRSTNEGISWTPVLQNIPNGNQQDWAYDLIVNPKNHCMVFAAMHEYGVYRSLNCGDSWSSMNGNGLSDLSGRALAINPDGTGSDALYYATWHRTGVYKSTNNGSNWTNQYLYAKIYDMDLDPIQPNVVYLADFNDGVYKTTNGGGNWSNIGLSENLIYTVMVNPLQHTQVFVGTSGNGIFRSDASGSGWVHSQAGLNNAMVTGFQIHPTQSGILFTSVSRAGFYYSQNDGETWQQLNNGLSDLDASGIVINPQNANQLFILTFGGGLFACTMPSCAWTSKNSGLPKISADRQILKGFSAKNELEEEIEADILASDTLMDDTQALPPVYQALNDMQFSLSNPAFAYLATVTGVYRSQNGGGNWISAGLGGKNILKVAVNPTNNQVVYASESGKSTVYTSTNAGGSWSSSQVPGGNVNDLTIVPSKPGVLYAATNQGVYKRSDGGNWQLLGLADKNVTAFSVHPGLENFMVAGCGAEAFYSKDGGQSWFSATINLDRTIIKKVTFDPSKSDLVYLSTNTQGNYRLVIQ